MASQMAPALDGDLVTYRTTHLSSRIEQWLDSRRRESFSLMISRQYRDVKEISKCTKL